VVLDVDETVLDNVPYQAQLVIDDDSYGSESWDRWIELRAADATPGAVDFIEAAQSLGFHVVFITNRACRARDGVADPCPQYEDTIANLQSVGIGTGSTTLLLRGDRPPERCRRFLSDDERIDGTWSSVKTSRRACVSIDHDIVMLFGDQLGDFTEVDYENAAAAGRDTAAEHGARWGRDWFMLPNPTYGGWKPRSTGEKRALIRGID
jgi:acid phosphatase